MRVQQPNHAGPPPSSRPAQPSPPPPPPAPTSFGDTVGASVESWGHMGKKLGSLAAVTLAASSLPLLAVEAVINSNANIPMVVIGPLGIACSVGSMALAALEEKYIGIGKHVGHLAGAVAGAAVGTGQAGWQALTGGPSARPEQIQLEQKAPSGRAPHQPLVQAGINWTRKAITGGDDHRNRTIEIGEMVGSTVSTLALAYAVPHVVGSMLGGPVESFCGTLMGPLCGMVVGGALENVFGVGRGLGELAGRAVAAVHPPQEKIDRCGIPEGAGPFMKGFLKFNGLVGQPVMGFLVDTTMIANRAFTETPYQSIGFQDRPAPQVNRDRLIQNFVTLAGTHGPSGHQQLVADELEKRLDSLGIAWKRLEDNSLIATVPATPGQEDAPTVMLSSHQDSVTATKAENIIVGKRRIHTNEKSVLGADDRAGLAEILEAVQVIQEQKLAHPEIKLVFTVDEERGLVGANRLRPEDISTRPTLGFVVDALDPRDLHLTNDAVIVNPNSVKYNFSQEEPLVQVAFRSMANAGVEPRAIHAPILTGAGSDANTLGMNSKNIHSIAVGAGERDMHTPLEYVTIEDLQQAARHIVGYVTNSCDLKVEGDKIVPRYDLAR